MCLNARPVAAPYNVSYIVGPLFRFEKPVTTAHHKGGLITSGDATCCAPTPRCKMYHAIPYDCTILRRIADGKYAML